jgi:uncharacterized DUF497 family protein
MVSPYCEHVPTAVSGDYEWSESKAEASLVKHGVSFDEAAAALDSDPDEVAVRDPSIHRAHTRSSCRFAPASFSW